MPGFRRLLMASLFKRLLWLLWTGSMLLLAIILLPLLLLSRKIREFFFVLFFWVGTTILSETFANSRRCALKPLQSIKSHDPRLRKIDAIRVLEIGAGLGGNFEHINRTIKYTNVDPNVEFGSAFLRQLQRNPKVELEQWIHGYGEDMSELASSHFDVVMFTYLLCSAKNTRKVLEEAKRVMVKGGTLIFLEHVAFPRGTWQRLVQNALTPLWKVICCNCHLNRESVQQIEDAGFAYVMANYIDADISFILRRQAYGIAVS